MWVCQGCLHVVLRLIKTEIHKIFLKLLKSNFFLLITPWLAVYFFFIQFSSILFSVSVYVVSIRFYVS